MTEQVSSPAQAGRGSIRVRVKLRRHHRAGAVSAFTRVFDALWRRDPVIPLRRALCLPKRDGRVKPGHDVAREEPAMTYGGLVAI